MAYSSYQNSNNIVPYYADIVADALTDISEIPTDYAVGSTCLVIEDSSVWILGNDKTWHQI